jgi:hypothetical protein
MSYPVSDLELLSRLRGKTVALVGAADSITGTGSGPEIDSHDVVVRVNNGFNIVESMKPDVGTRTDVVYHVGVTTTCDGTGTGLNPIENRNTEGVRNIDRNDFETMVSAGVGFLMLSVPPHSKRVEYVKSLVDSRIPWARFPRDYRTELHWKIGTFPNTGVVATWHMLRSDLVSLDLYGFDFFATAHYPGYNNETEEYRLTAGSRPTDFPHNQEKQIDFIGKTWVDDRRLTLPPTARSRVEERGWKRRES